MKAQANQTHCTKFELLGTYRLTYVVILLKEVLGLRYTGKYEGRDSSF